MLILQIIDKELDFILEDIENLSNEDIKKRLVLIKEIIKINNDNEIISLPKWSIGE